MSSQLAFARNVSASHWFHLSWLQVVGNMSADRNRLSLFFPSALVIARSGG